MILYDAGRLGIGRGLWHLQGCVFPRAALFALGPCIATMVIGFILQASVDREEIEKNASSEDLMRLHSTFTWVFGFVLVFRTTAAWNRYWEGAVSLKSMGVEWYDACAGIVNFAQLGAKDSATTKAFQGSTVRLFSLLHCVALQKACVCNEESFDVVDLEGLNPDLFKGLMSLSDPAEKPEVVFQWIQRLILDGVNQGFITTPPPIVTRVFQELNTGMQSLNRMSVITDVPFPFPYAQMLSSLLILQALITPILLGTSAVHPLFSSIFAFISVFTLCSLNLIAQEIEHPFGDDINDLDCIQAQRAFNCSLLLLLDPLTQASPNIDPIRANEVKRLSKYGELVDQDAHDSDEMLGTESARLQSASATKLTKQITRQGSAVLKSLSSSLSNDGLSPSKSALLIAKDAVRQQRVPKFPDSQPEPEKQAENASEEVSECTPAIPVHVEIVPTEALRSTASTGKAQMLHSESQWVKEIATCTRRIEGTLHESFIKMSAVHESMTKLVRLTIENGANVYELTQLATKPGIVVRTADAGEAFLASADLRAETSRTHKGGALCSFDMPCRSSKPEVPEVQHKDHSNK